jgi:hypothetical protein
MITAEKLSVFRKFNGNLDYWQHARMLGIDIITEQEFFELDRLLQELGQLKKSLVSADYEERIRQKLAKIAPDENIACALMEMA